MRVVSVWKPSTRMSHISRMCSAMSCGMPSAGRGMFGLSSVGRQPCSSPFLPALLDALLDVADRVEILVELALVGRADVAAQVVGVGQHGVEHALVAALHFVLEQPVEGERRIQFQRRRRGRRAPRDVRAVEHRVVLVDRRVRLLAAQHQARHFGRAAVASARAAGRCWCPSGSRRRRRAARRRADCRSASCGCCPSAPRSLYRPRMNSIFSRKSVERREHLAQLHLRCLRPWPTTPCCGSRCRRTARPAAPALRSAARAPSARRPRRCSDSSHGSAIVTPRPRSNVRREKSVCCHVDCSSAFESSWHCRCDVMRLIVIRHRPRSLPRISRNCRLRTIVSTAARDAVVVASPAVAASRRAAARRKAARRGPGRSRAACGRTAAGTRRAACVSR